MRSAKAFSGLDAPGAGLLLDETYSTRPMMAFQKPMAVQGRVRPKVSSMAQSELLLPNRGSFGVWEKVLHRYYPYWNDWWAICPGVTLLGCNASPYVAPRRESFELGHPGGRVGRPAVRPGQQCCLRVDRHPLQVDQPRDALLGERH